MSSVKKAYTRAVELANLSLMQPLLMLLVTLVHFLLTALKKAYRNVDHVGSMLDRNAAVHKMQIGAVNIN